LCRCSWSSRAAGVGSCRAGGIGGGLRRWVRRPAGWEQCAADRGGCAAGGEVPEAVGGGVDERLRVGVVAEGAEEDGAGHGDGDDAARSEEHTSELQSPCNLVCRLLLEKK